MTYPDPLIDIIETDSERDLRRRLDAAENIICQYNRAFAAIFAACEPSRKTVILSFGDDQ